MHIKKMAAIGSAGYSLWVGDGTYYWSIIISNTRIWGASYNGFVTGWSHSFDTTTAYNTYVFAVKGTAFELLINEVSRATDVLDSAGVTTRLQLYGSSLTTPWKTYIDYIKYFLNGNTPPIY
jgi:hypothetical protein